MTEKQALGPRWQEDGSGLVLRRVVELDYGETRTEVRLYARIRGDAPTSLFAGYDIGMWHYSKHETVADAKTKGEELLSEWGTGSPFFTGGRWLVEDE